MTNDHKPRLHVEDPALAWPWALATLSRLEANVEVAWPPAEPVEELWLLLESAVALGKRRMAAAGPALLAGRVLWLGLPADLRRAIAALQPGLDLEGKDYYSTPHDLPPDPVEATISNLRPGWQACQHAIAAFQQRVDALGQESLSETGVLAAHAVLLALSLAEREDPVGLDMVPVLLGLLGRPDLFREAAGPSCTPK
jgi:hypothetical protein